MGDRGKQGLMREFEEGCRVGKDEDGVVAAEIEDVQ